LQEEISIEQKAETKNNKYLIIGIIAGILILAAVVVATIFLVRADKDVTAQIRDIFIIFMALTSLVLGIALVVLIVQLAILINLLQNEIRPILDSTTETVNTLKGTTQFLSNNLTEPVIKLNEYLAMFKRIIKPSKK
jgi:NADH:ubiquinone oxidoreductase subunit K